ncbi:hypothetical protein [Chondromyces apiculatus]|uniref:hypothetical protein n=1 Tax=Chondromyces apiculatus TaxID=51 RepID=UPI0018CC27A3|nr:hypothetical protein [Chondromyces apiculatus]
MFRGVLLRRDDGSEWVIAEGAETPLHAMDGRRVRVEGMAYEPEGQALVLRHLRVAVLTIADLKEDAPYVEVRSEERLEGKFEPFTYPEGTKLAGERTILFIAAGGERFHVAHMPLKEREERLLGRALTVVGFRVEPSRFIARPGGPYLWIQDIEEGKGQAP